MQISEEHLLKIIGTLIIVLLIPFVRTITKKITRKYGLVSGISEVRTKMMLKFLFSLINISVVILMIVLWGVDPKNIFVFLSSIFAVIGVALFAQWSILSNITSGVIIFFTIPMRIGDQIRLLDKDYPIEAEIEDIKAFHIHLKSLNGDRIVIPNSILLQKGVVLTSRMDYFKNIKINPEESDL